MLIVHAPPSPPPGPPPNGEPGPPNGCPCCCACSYIRQLAPSSSYLRRLSGSPSTSYASLISLNLLSAPLSPGLTSGWCFLASFRNACLISFSVAVFGSPSVL